MDNRVFDLELFIAKFLRYGVLFAGFLIFIGWMSQINLQANIFESYQRYEHVSLTLTIKSLLTDHNWGLITAYLGLIVLIALPLTRVALVAVVFLFEKDFLLATCALIVLFGLALSFALGFEI